MSTSSKTKCKQCGGVKRAKDIVCPECWRKLPGTLRADYNTATTAKDSDARFAAVTAICDHVNGTDSFI